MAQSNNFNYVGAELDLFAHAVNWKLYWSSLIKDYLKGDILEVGAGKGVNTELLYSERYASWISLEPDKEMADFLNGSYAKNPNYNNYEVINGTIKSLSEEQMFDTIIYIDVLEHIEKDKEEIKKVSEHLKPGGYLIILSPSLQILFSEFDRAIGHYRRYKKSSIENILTPKLKVESLIYLDSLGVLVSLANRFLLKQNNPTLKQIKIWDKFIVPCSKYADRLVNFSFGKSILAVIRLQK
jgi:SAM-dependent methyltransferase